MCHTACDLEDTEHWNSSSALLGGLRYGGRHLVGTGRHWEGCLREMVLLSNTELSYFGVAPSQPPGNIMWNSSDSKIILNWDQVKALDNESEVRGYKVSVLPAEAAGQHCPAAPLPHHPLRPQGTLPELQLSLSSGTGLQGTFPRSHCQVLTVRADEIFLMAHTCFSRLKPTIPPQTEATPVQTEHVLLAAHPPYGNAHAWSTHEGLSPQTFTRSFPLKLPLQSCSPAFGGNLPKTGLDSLIADK